MKEAILISLWEICADEVIPPFDDTSADVVKGEVQIATALLAVAHPHLTFDMPRAERIVSAYVGQFNVTALSCADHTDHRDPFTSTPHVFGSVRP